MHKWPVGPLMAQAAHVATAVIHENVDSPEVKEYLANLQGMRKTVMEVCGRETTKLIQGT